MKKQLSITMVLVFILSLGACSLMPDKKAIESVVTRIKADELDSAINIMKEMDEKTLSGGKGGILTAVIEEINTYLNYNSWISTNYHFIDESVIKDFEKYQTIVNFLPLDSEESNVDDFIRRALSLKQYIKWNDYHSSDAAEKFEKIKSKTDKGAIYKSAPFIASKYHKEAYNDCIDAYDKFSNYTGYGMKEAANFYYNYAIKTNAIITQSGTTSAQDDEYNEATSRFKRIQQEHINDLDDIIEICESFPKELY